MMKCLGIFTLLLCSSVLRCQDIGEVKGGKLDLSNWNSLEKPVISLDGEWEFYWGKLLLSKDLKNHPRQIARLSMPWSEQLIGGQRKPKNGFATYALTIRLPENTDSVAFAVPAVFNAYSFWVNDKLICESGKVGKTAAEMVPRWRPQTVIVATSGSDTLNVVFQISNFQNTRGGCAEVMRIGNASYLSNIDSTFRKSGVALLLLFCVTSLALFVIFFVIRANSFLFMSLMSLAYAIRFLFSDLYFYYDLGLNVSWEVAAKMEYVTIPLIIICASFFISSIYPKEFKRIALYLLTISNSLLIAAVIFSPSSLFSPLLVVIQVMGLSLVIYIVIVIVRALVYQKVGAWISALSIIVFAAVGFYNIYAFISVSDLNRVIIDIGYALALLLNVISLLYRTPLRLHSEEQDMMRFSDFYNEQGSIRIE